MVDSEEFIDLPDIRRKEDESDISKLADKIFGSGIEEHTRVNIRERGKLLGCKALTSLYPGLGFYENVANNFMTIQPSLNGGSRNELVAVGTGFNRPAIIEKRQVLEQEEGRLPEKRTKKGFFRRFF